MYAGAGVTGLLPHTVMYNRAATIDPPSIERQITESKNTHKNNTYPVRIAVYSYAGTRVHCECTSLLMHVSCARGCLYLNMNLYETLSIQAL